MKGLALEFPGKDCLDTKAFKKMNKLRLLCLAGVKLKGDFKYLSRDLRWLYWHGFPKTYAPAEFQQESLVAVELKYSKLKQLWNKSQVKLLIYFSLYKIASDFSAASHGLINSKHDMLTAASHLTNNAITD